MSLLRKSPSTAGKCEFYASFWCGGCNEEHTIPIRGEHGWGFDGNDESPSFVPSVLVHEVKRVDGSTYTPRCHLFVTAGNIHYLDDSQHDLKGQIVPMTDIDEALS